MIRGSDNQAEVHETVTFCASGDTIENSKVVTWDLGDGYLGFAPVVVHSYSEEGLYDVRLWATDASGATGDDLAAIQII